MAFLLRSLQGRLLIGFLAIWAPILAAGGIFIHEAIHKQLHRGFDNALLDKSRFYELSAYFGDANDRMKFIFGPSDFLQRHGKKQADDYAEATFREAVYRAPHQWDGHLPMDLATDDDPQWRDITLPDGRPGRACGRIIFPPRRYPVTAAPQPMNPPAPVKLVVASETASLQASQARLKTLFYQTGGASILIALGAAGFLIRRGMQPVGELDRQIEVIPLADPGARFSLPGAPSELEPVVTRLNALMDRVTSAIEHERQFTSNAAHELRNPLAAIRAQCETALSRTRSLEEYEDTIAGVLESQQGMQRVVDHLLLLARLEAGPQKDLPCETVSLTKMLRKAWRQCVDRAAERGLPVTWSVEEREITLPVAMTEMLAANLFDNAVNYTPDGGRISIDARAHGAEFCLRVTNTNPGLTPEQVEQTFSPFWRADPNASGHRGNAGIGLALCRRIAATLGGNLTGSLDGDAIIYEARLRVEAPAEIESPVSGTSLATPAESVAS